MRNRTPLSFQEAMDEIEKLRIPLLAAIVRSGALAKETAKAYMIDAHHYHVAVVRYGGSIADIVRRYNLDCPICMERKGNDYHEMMLCEWHLVDRETLLKCHECQYHIAIELHSDKDRIRELIALAPVQVLDRFRPERE